MGGLFSRIKVWGATDTLTATDLNNEFNNIINNFIPQEMASFESNVSQMQLQQSPGNLGSESLAASLAGEIEQLRFVLAEITGNTYWYQPPVTSLAAINNLVGNPSANNVIVSGITEASSSQPVFLVANGTAPTVTLSAAATAFVYKIAGTSYTIGTNVTLTGLTTAPTVNNTMIINDPLLTGAQGSNLVGENGSTITVATMGSNISSLIGKYASFGTSNNEYVFGLVSSATTITNVFRGYYFNSSSTLVARAAVTNGNTWTLLQTAWIFVTTAKGLAVCYTNPSYGGSQPSSPSIGDYWYNTSTNLWNTYNGTSWVVANATLIGVACISGSAALGTRSFDFYNNYLSLNTVEVGVTPGGNTAVVKSQGAQISVYGATISLGNTNNFQWSGSSNMESGQTFSANTYYYFYVTQAGSPIISNVAPFDRRADLQGYYHPAHAWRCVGYAFTTTSVAQWDQASYAESFFRVNPTKPVYTVRSGVVPSFANTPSYIQPFSPQQTVEMIEYSATSGGFTQILPPPSQWEGRRIILIKQDNTFNQVTLQAYATAAATLTGAPAGTTFLPSATTGITTGTVYLASGKCILPGTTATLGSNGTVTFSQSINMVGLDINAVVVFSLVQGLPTTLVNALNVGIGGNFTTGLSTQGETLELYSDGTGAQVIHRHIPSQWQIGNTITVTGTVTNPTFGSGGGFSYVQWRRVGSNMEVRFQAVGPTAGTAGSGDYLWSLPTVNSTTVSINNYVAPTTGSNLNNTNPTTPVVVLGNGVLANSSVPSNGTSPLAIFPGTTSTTIKLAFYSGTTAGWVSLSNNSGSFGSTGWSYMANYSVPILGWADDGQ